MPAGAGPGPLPGLLLRPVPGAMNYRQIEIFAAIMECASITEAAMRLHLSQPAVSKSLKALEDELGLRLFQRTTRGLHATDEAREFYAEASRVLMGFGHLGAFARTLRDLGHARIVVSTMVALSLKWLPEVTSEFVRLFPDVAFEFQFRSSTETVRLVAQGEVDVGIAQARSNDLSVQRQRVFDLSAVCALPAGHPLALRSSLHARDLQGQTIISLAEGDEFRRLFEATLAAHGVGVRSRIEVALGVMLCALVEAGGGIGIVDVETARAVNGPGIAFRRLEPAVRVPIYALRNVHKPQGLAVQRFIEHLLRRAPRPWSDGPAPDDPGG